MPQLTLKYRDPKLAVRRESEEFFYEAPGVEVPRWLVWIFPSFKGLETNPLYLRSSGKAFTGGRRGIYHAGEELHAARRQAPIDLMGAAAFGILSFFVAVVVVIGYVTQTDGFYLAVFQLLSYFFERIRIDGSVLPVIEAALNWIWSLCAACGPVALFGAVAFLCVAILGGMLGALGSIRFQNFFLNAAHQPWGEDLILCELRPEEYTRGMMAGLFEGDVRAIRRGLIAGLMVFGLWVVFQFFYFPKLPWIEPMLMGFFGLIALAIEMCILSGVRLLAALASVATSDQTGAADVGNGFMVSLDLLAASHLPGLGVMGLIAIERLRGSETYNNGIGVLAHHGVLLIVGAALLLFAYFVINIVCVILPARYFLAMFEGAPARRLFMKIRK